MFTMRGQDPAFDARVDALVIQGESPGIAVLKAAGFMEGRHFCRPTASDATDDQTAKPQLAGLAV